MLTIIEINTTEEVLNGTVVKPSRILAKLELHLPDDTNIDHNQANDIRNKLLIIATNYALGPGEATQ